MDGHRVGYQRIVHRLKDAGILCAVQATGIDGYEQVCRCCIRLQFQPREQLIGFSSNQIELNSGASPKFLEKRFDQLLLACRIDVDCICVYLCMQLCREHYRKWQNQQ